ncbi:unnamed protein product [Urochloa humidicola]
MVPLAVVTIAPRLLAVKSNLLNVEKEEFKRWWRGLRYKDIEFLRTELRSIQAALRLVGVVPLEQLPQHLKNWADLSREMLYDIQDILDTFLVRVEESHPPDGSKGLISKMASPFHFKRNKIRREIADAVRDVKIKVHNIARLRDLHADRLVARNRFDPVAANPAPAATSVDPRLLAMLKDQTGFVGTDLPRDELISMLTEGDDVSSQQLKVVSIVGSGGMGKTTLANIVYKELQSQFDCSAFVFLSVSPNMKQVFNNMLKQLDNEKYRDISETSWDEQQLMDELRQLLQDKRYLMVIDDIWESKSWQTIRDAMVENNLGSRIITTTRKTEIAEQVGTVYKLNPLSNDGSKALFYKRAFGSGGKYPGNQLDSITDKILQKCGGLPLAVVSIASVVANKPPEVWHDVFNRISSVLEGDVEADSIRRQLLLSYYHLPSHLRACFLYISVFPEDYEFRRDRLVWRWIAEGFIEGKQGWSLFQTGQIYFQKLLNLSMIQEVEKNVCDGMTKYCQVHDLMHDMACSLAREENFATKLVDEQEQQTSEYKVRRLSLQSSRLLEMRTSCTMKLPHVRSVCAFGTGINLMPPLSRFQVLRVLDFEGCDLRGSYYDLKHLGELLHLRYLGLRGTNVDHLPKGIGNLRFLQILDLKGTTIRVLPSTVVLLHKLLCLYTEHGTRMPKGLENLKSLEELSKVSVSEYPGFIKELASLVELRVLDIVLPQDVSESSQKHLMESLCNLHKIQDLRVSGCSDLDFMREGWEPTPSLKRFIAVDGWFSVLPTCVSNAQKLSELEVGVREMWREDLQALGRLPELSFLRLAVERMGERLAVDADSFPSLTQLRLRGETCLVFRRRAMPKLTVLEFDLDVDKADGDLEWGLGNLRFLQKVTVNLRSANDASAVSAQEALRRATSAHPNRPTLEITMLQPVSEADKIYNVASTSSDIQEERSA